MYKDDEYKNKLLVMLPNLPSEGDGLDGEV